VGFTDADRRFFETMRADDADHFLSAMTPEAGERFARQGGPQSVRRSLRAADSGLIGE
jgi:hypothetical protein